MSRPLYLTSLINTRYVLKIKDTDEVLFMVVFSLLHKEDVEKEEAEAKKGGEITEVAPQGSEKTFEPMPDDLD